MRRPTVQGAARRTHYAKFQYHGANRLFGGSAEHRCGAQKRTIARTARKSGEYRRIRGRTYCPGAAIRARIGGSGRTSGESGLKRLQNSLLGGMRSISGMLTPSTISAACRFMSASAFSKSWRIPGSVSGPMKSCLTTPIRVPRNPSLSENFK
jgi:hypothetical protein